MSFLWAIETGIASPPHGDTQAGYYGTVVSGDFISGDSLASDIGLTAGTAYNSTCDWLKFAWNEGIVMVPQKPFRYDISWDSIYLNGSVYGDGLKAGEDGAEHHNTDSSSGTLTAIRQDTEVTINGDTYKVRLFRGADEDPVTESNNDDSILGPNNEWNHLMLPIHTNAPNSWVYLTDVDEPTEDWGINFTDQDLLTDNDYGEGARQWGQETDSMDVGNRIMRGNKGVSTLGTDWSHNPYYGWRPLLEKQ